MYDLVIVFILDALIPIHNLRPRCREGREWKDPTLKTENRR